VLFEELIEQHRVDRVEADGNDLPVRIAHCQVGTHFGYFLGDEAKDLYVGWINIAVVAERDRFESEQRFTGVADWLDVVLISARRART
jgi:hypothetical protein